MNLFKLFSRHKGKKSAQQNPPPVDRSNWTGKNFEFLITGDINLTAEEFDQIMTPNSISVQRIIRDGWSYYIVGDDEFSYSMEMPGIQMTFNSEITFLKAKLIADEVVNKLKKKGFNADLVILDKSKVYRF
jgi:hypothetical protein